MNLKAMTLEQLYAERNRLRRQMGWGTFHFGDAPTGHEKHYENIKEILAAIEDELDLRIFGRVVLY